MRQNRSVDIYEEDKIPDLNPQMSALLEYFKGKTHGSRLPCRDDIKPEELIEYLPRVILGDVISSEGDQGPDIYIRLMGTTAARDYGEMTGHLMSEFQGTKLGERLLATARACIAERKTLAYGTHLSKVGDYYMMTQALFVPLIDGETNSYIERIFCTVFNQYKSIQTEAKLEATYV